MRRRFAILCLLAGLWTVSAARAIAAAAVPQNTKVAIVTPLGTIVVALDPVHAPLTVRGFLHYVDANFYNGGAFFRAAPGLMIHGGNPARERKSDPHIPYEPPLKTGLVASDGAIAMSGPRGPRDATSEFFICDGNHPELNGSMAAPGYAVFGHVIQGMRLVRYIADLPIQPATQKLLNPVRILRIERLH